MHGEPGPPLQERPGPLHGQLRRGLRGGAGRAAGHHAGARLFRGHHRDRRGPHLHHPGLRRGQLPVHRHPGALQEAEEPHQPPHRQPGHLGLPGGHRVLPLPGGLLRGEAAVLGPRAGAVRLHKLPQDRVPVRVHQCAAGHRCRQVHGHSPSSEAAHEVPDGLLPDHGGVDRASPHLHPLGLLRLGDHVPARPHPQQDLLRPDLARGPAALLPLLLPVRLRRGVRGARADHGAVLRPDLAGAVVQERAGLPDGADPEAAALPEEDRDGAHRHPHRLLPVLGAVLRLRHPARLPPHRHLPPAALAGGLLHRGVHRHEQQHDQHAVLRQRQEQHRQAPAQDRPAPLAVQLRPARQGRGRGRGPDVLHAGDGGGGLHTSAVGRGWGSLMPHFPDPALSLRPFVRGRDRFLTPQGDEEDRVRISAPASLSS
ncbi:hypothetical protein ANANG_G00050910 [Anguilla anguilla]|uniref:Uncharacterized protein n=1 Tax=Anguilla anguilla TaxID=7936 RepID=A0A9D3MVC0_ANGAN|nr:hypothetical protein ANANG_G00050910 [Anguilla anguilla]